MAIKKNDKKKTDCFGKENLTKNFWTSEKTDKCRIKRNDDLEGLCHKQNVLYSIRNRK